MKRLHILLLVVIGGITLLSWAGGPESSRLLPATASYSEQMSAVSGGRYSSQELFALLENPEAVSGLSPNQERAVLNEVMNKLRKIAAPDSVLEEAFMRIASDSSRDPGVREYAVQHLYLCHSTSENRDVVQEYLWKFAKDPILSTCAILQLHHLGLKKGITLSRPLAPVVFEAMQRGNLRNADRATLLVVAAERGWTEALPFAREWGINTGDQVVLRAVLTAIGKLGDVRDLEYLKELESRQNMQNMQKSIEFTRTSLTLEGIKDATQ